MRNIEFLHPDIRWSDIYKSIRSIRSGWLVPGEQARIFEEQFAKFLQVESSFLTSSATASIEIALLLAGVGQGDEVICPSITWVSAATSIKWLGARPVFCDVNRDTYLPDHETIENLINERTKAIIVTHLYGQMADMKTLSEVASKYNIKLIEDAAHAIEAKRDGVKPGHLSFAACFSFHAAKNITSGQGGSLVVKAPAENVRLARRCGVYNNEFDERVMKSFGGKFDLTDFQAALLIGQLERIEKSWEKRRKVFEYYEEMCKDLELKFPNRRVQDKHGFHQFTFEVCPEKRRNIRQFLSRKGINTSIHFKPVHQEPYFIETQLPSVLPNSEAIGARTVSLPTHTNLNSRDLTYIRKNLKEALRVVEN